MNKKDIYNKINEFNIRISSSKETKNNKYYYIQSDEALLKSKFIKKILKDETIKNKLDSIEMIMDLCFGSGNLISHILLENQIEYKNIILNDYFLNECNQELENLLENCELKQCNFFNSDCFEENSVDLLIFNPTHGGKPTTKNFVDKENKDFDALNETLSKILKPNAIVIFRGWKEDFQELIFSEFKYKKIYLDGTQSLYVCYDIEIEKTECYEYEESEFILNEDCKNTENHDIEDNSNISELINSLNDLKIDNEIKCLSFYKKNILNTFSSESKGKKNCLEDFRYKNILFKGVPGTGKSETIKNIINNKLGMKELTDNILRINIHSASSNSDLMQGISISTTENNENVIYKEKQGAILNHIFKAIYKPKQPFVLVLEEIQENSLNELIGDLIYLIEDNKRTIIDLDIPDNTELAYAELFKKVNQKAKDEGEDLYYVELPSLVENSENNTKMIVPDNLFIFCTSNYRDDKKVIEDNLLRRFDVIEIYPKYDGIYKSEDIPKFLKKLNDNIIEQFKDETHPDRYLIGHANWLFIEEDSGENNATNKKEFYKSLLKVVIEFKEIREIDFDHYVKPILKKVLKKDDEYSERIKKYLEIFYKEDNLELKSYKDIVDILQQEVYKSFL